MGALHLPFLRALPPLVGTTSLQGTSPLLGELGWGAAVAWSEVTSHTTLGLAAVLMLAIGPLFPYGTACNVGAQDGASVVVVGAGRCEHFFVLSLHIVAP